MNSFKKLEKWKTVEISLPVAQGLNLHSETLLAVASTEQFLYTSPVPGTPWAASSPCGEAGDSGSCHRYGHFVRLLEIMRQTEGFLDLEAQNSHPPSV